MSEKRKNSESVNFSDISGDGKLTKEELGFIKNNDFLKQTFHKKNRETVKTRIEGKIGLDDLYKEVNIGLEGPESIERAIFLAKIEELVGYIEKNKKKKELSSILNKNLIVV